MKKTMKIFLIVTIIMMVFTGCKKMVITDTTESTTPVSTTQSTTPVTTTPVTTTTVATYMLAFLSEDLSVIQSAYYVAGADLSGVTLPTPPVSSQEGYIFLKWSIEVPTTMPSENVSITATYTINSYNLEYRDYDNNLLQTTSYDYNTLLSTHTPPSNPSRSGYTFTGWDASLPANMPASILVINASYSINSYNLEYRDYDNNLLQTTTYVYNTLLTSHIPPSNPSRVGYTFTGWDASLPTNMPASILVINASYSINSYNLEYRDYDNNLLQTTSYDYNTLLSTHTPPSNPSRSGYTFTGWDASLPTNMPNENVTIIAEYIIGEFTLSFNTFDGTIVDSITQIYNTVVNAPADPTKANNYFDGWYDDLEFTNNYTFTTMPAENKVIFAKWTPYFSLNYTTNASEITITGITIDSRYILNIDLVIPSTINDLNVVAIADSSFANNQRIISVTFNENLRLIGHLSFFNNQNITSITIPTSVTQIGQQAFKTNTLLDTINFASLGNLSIIDEQAFHGTAIASLVIPKSVTRINSSAFHIGSILINLTFDSDSNLEVIGDYAFSNSYISSLTIPNSVTIIGDHAFYQTYRLEEVLFEENSILETISSNAFYQAILTEGIIIPSSVITIGAQAFGRTQMPTLVFEAGSELETIGDNAFEFSYHLLELNLPSGLKYISQQAFINNNKLTSVNIPASVLSIGDYAFYGIASMLTLTFEGGSLLETIGLSAFQNCGITSVTFPNNLETIGIASFRQTEMTSITIPKSVITIGGSAFRDCTNLATMTFESESSLEYFGNSCITGTKIASIIIPGSVKTIDTSAFSNCTTLTSITFEAGTENLMISHSAFRNTAITSIVIPNRTTWMGSEVFYGVSTLTSITLPFTGSARGAVNQYHLFGYIFGTTPYTGGSATLQYYNGGSVVNYIPNSLTEVIITDALRVDYGCFSFCNNITSITLNDEITILGNMAFYGASKLTSITIPENTTQIGNHCFRDTFLLLTVTIPADNVISSIGSEAFRNSGITSFVWPDGVFNISSLVFAGTTSLLEITISGSSTLVQIENSAFLGSAIESIDLARINNLGNNVFENCLNLESIVITNTISNIGINVFKGCVNLSLVTFEEGATLAIINGAAFMNCSSLTTIKIPSSITDINATAFSGCTLLDIITIDGEGVSNSDVNLNNMSITTRNVVYVKIGLAISTVITNNFGITVSDLEGYDKYIVV